MSITKFSPRKMSIEALNNPEGWDFFNPELKKPLVKVASIQKSVDLNGFNLKQAISDNPENLFVKVFAIKKDEVNDNGDAFSEEELKKSASTFIDVPVFVNHQNDNIENARGKVVHAWYDDDAGGIYTINMVDKVAFPQLARGIEQGYVVGTSMGCSVTTSVCSICGNAAHTDKDYCDHIKNKKTRMHPAGRVKHAYGKNGITVEGYDNCPVKFEVDDEGYILHKEAQKVYEHNFGINFIEDSFVVNPACHECLVQDILSPDTVLMKAASAMTSISKRTDDISHNIAAETMKKSAGQKELMVLNAAMDQVEYVAKAVMAQKQQVDVEYASELVKIMSDMQKTLDELEEMGYGQLNSPSQESVEAVQAPATNGADVNVPDMTQQLQNNQNSEPQAQPQVAPQASGFESNSLEEDLGTVTTPKFSSENTRKKKDFLQDAVNLMDRIASMQDQVDNFNKLAHTKEYRMEKDSTNSNGQQKEAYGLDEQPTNVTTEKQLNSTVGKEYAGARETYSPEVVTEKQLDDAPDVNVTTSVSPQDRDDPKQNHPDTITQKQLGGDAASDTYVSWGNVPDVITEKQWSDTARMIGSELSRSQDDIVTEKQLADFLSHHRYEDYDVITQKQLDDKAFATTGDISRWAFQNNTKKYVEAAMNAAAEAIADFGKTPAEIKKVANVLNSSVKNLDKAAYLTLVNAASYKADSISAMKDKINYFGTKTASVKAPTATDAVIISLASNLGSLKADDLVETFKHVLASESALKQIEASAETKMNKEATTEVVVDKFAQVQEALTEMNSSDDGIYKVEAMIEEIDADVQDKTAFVKATYKFASQQVNETIGSEADVVLTEIAIDDESETVVATLKVKDILTADEAAAWTKLAEECVDCEAEDVKEASTEEEVKEASTDEEVKEASAKDAELDKRASAREEMVKEAQMFGGQMGGGMDAGGEPGALGGDAGGMGMDPNAGLETFEADAPEDAEVEEDRGELPPKPPGAVCPVCGSYDVDIVKGQAKCNNCGSEMKFKVEVEVTKWADLLSTEEEGGEEVEGEDVAGEGFDMEPATPAADATPAAGAEMGMPAAASTSNDKIVKVARSLNSFKSVAKITPEAVAIAKEAGIEFGRVSPITGSTNTVKLASGKYVCLETGMEYTVETATFKDKPEEAYAQWSWNPKTIEAQCDTCAKKRAAFRTAIASTGTTLDQFEDMNIEEQAKVALAAQKNGAFVKTASAENGSVIEEIKKFASKEYKFPVEDCREIIARRYGEDAVALSGPNEGMKLADCVCVSLKTAGVYSHNIALKTASIWKDRNGCDECVEDMIRSGKDHKVATAICDVIKTKFAGWDDMLAEELVAVDPMDEGPSDPFDGGPDEDPFSDEEVDEVATITLEVDADVLNQLEEAIDVAKGEDPASEPHHDEVPEGIAVEVEVDADAVDTVEDAAEEVLEDVAGGEVAEPEAPALENLDESGEDMLMMEKNEEKPEKEEGIAEDVVEKEDTEEKIDDAGKQYKEGDDEEDDSEMYMEREASSMRKGYIGNTGKINLDLSAVEAVLNKQAGKVSVTPAQDAADVPSGDATIGGEEKFDAAKPDVPQGKATMGDEDADLQKADKADVFTGDAKMGEEENDSEMTDKVTGGDAGQGGEERVASTKEMISKMAERIVEATSVERKQVQDQEDLEVPRGDALIGGEKESIGEVPAPEVTPSSVPAGGDKAFIGNEKESIGGKPDGADIPTDDARIGGEKDNDKIAPEKDNQMTGNANQSSVTASSGKDSKEAATKLAGRLLEAKKIGVSDLSAKIAEFSQMSPQALAEIDNAYFASKKGIEGEPDGLEQPVIISEASNQASQISLSNKIQGLFDLDKQNKVAEETEADIRKYYNR